MILLNEDSHEDDNFHLTKLEMQSTNFFFKLSVAIIREKSLFSKNIIKAYDNNTKFAFDVEKFCFALFFKVCL